MNLRPYPEYKDSGVEWIGEIPDGWDIFKLKHVVNEFVSGGTPRSDNEKFWSQDDNEGIPWVAIGDMSNKEYVNVTNKKITVDGLADKKLRVLKKGTILYSIFASLGKVSILNINATTNQAILGLILSNRINNSYLRYYLKFLEEPIIALSNANTQNNLNSTIVKSISMSLPENIVQQEQIASFLDKKTSEIDKTIEKDTRLIELLKEKRIALINHVVTKGFDPDAPMKDSGIEWVGKIPENAEIMSLKRISSKITQGPNPDLSSDVEFSNYKVLKTKDLYDDGIRYKTTDYLSENAYFNCVNSRLEDNDILITIVGHGSIGKINIFESQKEHYIFTRAIALVRPLLNEINPKFIKYFFESKLGKELLYSLIEGSTGQEVIKTTKLSDLKIVVPHKDQQDVIIKVLNKKTSNIDKTINKIQSKINLLHEYKKSLIHHVVTGKVDVREGAV